MAVALHVVWRFLWRIRKVVFLVSLALLCYGLFRHEPPPQLFEHSDKLLHSLAFLGFALCTRAAFDQLPHWFLWPVMVALAIGSEWLQASLQPFRHFSWADIYANLIGIALAAFICVFVKLATNTHLTPKPSD